MEKKNIMIVEDEMVVAEDIRGCLEKSGYRVSKSVGSGEEAVTAVASASFDLVLMDIHLAGAIDGIEAAAAILGTVDVPIVYLTAYSDETILQRAKLTEPFGYLVKPFDRRELKTTIEMAIHKHRQLAKKFRTLAARTSPEDTGSLPGNGDVPVEHTFLGYGFRYSHQDGSLLYFGRETSLTKKESRFVRLLVENLDRTVTYEKIGSYVWDGSEVDQNTLRIFLWRLRSKIGKELVKNTPGLGYRIGNPPTE